MFDTVGEPRRFRFRHHGVIFKIYDYPKINL